MNVPEGYVEDLRVVNYGLEVNEGLVEQDAVWEESMRRKTEREKDSMADSPSGFTGLAAPADPPPVSAPCPSPSSHQPPAAPIPLTVQVLDNPIPPIFQLS